DSFHVAIIGAGITGVTLALGLQARNVSFTLYERHSEIRDIGAGIGFSPNAEQAMQLLHPDILAAFKEAANPNGEDYFQWIDGYLSGELIFKLHVGKDGFQGGRRSDILEAWAKLIEPTSIQFGKVLESIYDPGEDHTHDDTYNDDRVLLRFTDGTTATADAVIGCDGIHSRVRKHINSTATASPTTPDPQTLPNPNPGPLPQYTRKYCYRALAPMPAAIAAIGSAKAQTRYMYTGIGAHLLTYPVANNTLLNILAVISDPSPSAHWPHPHTTCAGSRSDVVEAFARWHPTVRAIVGLMPEEMDKWGIFDMHVQEEKEEDDETGSGSGSGLGSGSGSPYACGRVCVAGDAAHAAGPHLGAGGGMGVEDALALAELMAEVDGEGEMDGEGEVDEGWVDDRVNLRELVIGALKVYHDVRYGRTRRVIADTRKACDLFHWRDRRASTNPDVFGPAISQLFYDVWEYDVEAMAK
ncbi:FAD/NAD(P)-binding domain-containing protein, partial [Parathielavia hyrcaniae]